MKHLSMLLFFAARCIYPQDASPSPPVEISDFKAEVAWYTRRTYTDPWRHVRLIGEVTVDDYIFGGLERWGSGLSGYGKSLASVYGLRVIDNTAEFLLGTLVGDDARYRSSDKRGVVGRSLHATVDAFTARARSGNTRPAYLRIIAITAGTLIANQWRSDPRTGSSLTGALIFGVTDKIQDDLLQEFSPDLKRFGRSTRRKLHHALRQWPKRMLYETVLGRQAPTGCARELRP